MQFADLPEELVANVAVLDGEGRIMRVNEAWAAFAKANGFDDMSWGVGTNYLDICRATLGPDHLLCRELSALLSRKSALVTWVYPCHSPEKKRWFNLIGVPHAEGALLAHIDITGLVSEDGRREGPVVATSKAAMMPIFFHPPRTSVNAETREPKIDIDRLSPRQKQVLIHIRAGKSNGEIAVAMGLSISTVKKHVGSILRLAGASRRRGLFASPPETSEQSSL